MLNLENWGNGAYGTRVVASIVPIEQIAQQDTDAAGDADQRAELRIALAVLDFADPRPVHIEHAGELLLRDARGRPELLDLRSQHLFLVSFHPEST